MRAAFSALAALFLMTVPALGQGLLSAAEFRDAAIAMIAATAPDARVTVRDELGIDLQRDGGANEGAPSRINFDSAYNEYLNNPGALPDILDRWVRFAVNAPENSQFVERVVSVLRPRETVAELARAFGAGEQPAMPVWRPFAGDLAEVIVFDGAETIQYATEESLSELGLSPAQAWDAAPRNLPARLGALELSGIEGADALVYVSGGNGLAPSSLTNAELCAGEDAQALIFLVIERNAYVMADVNIGAAREQFAALLNDLRRSGNSLSFTPLGCRDGRVVEVQLTD